MRLKLPAYGRELLQQREAGQHPARVVVIYGDDWRPPNEQDRRVCVGSDYAPGVYDWSLLAGLPVTLLTRHTALMCELAAEVAAHAAPVEVHSQRGAFPVEMILYRNHPGWPGVAEDDYRARLAEWDAAHIEDICLAHD